MHLSAKISLLFSDSIYYIQNSKDDVCGNIIILEWNAAVNVLPVLVIEWTAGFWTALH